TTGLGEFPCRSHGVEFAPDSPLEGDGFELPVPRCAGIADSAARQCSAIPDIGVTQIAHRLYSDTVYERLQAGSRAVPRRLPLAPVAARGGEEPARRDRPHWPTR